MGGLSVRARGLQEEDSHVKSDEEDNWGRLKYDGRGGSYVEEMLEDTFRPIMRAFSRLRRRRNNVHWHKARQNQLTTDATDSTTAVLKVVISGIGSTVSEPTNVPPGVTSELQLSAPSTVQITHAIPTPTPTPAPLSTDSTAHLTLDSRITSTIVSTISNFAPNGTGGDLSRAPITTDGTIIVFTTPTVRNRTTLMNTLAKTTRLPKMNKTSTTSTALETSSASSSEIPTSTVFVEYAPIATADDYVPPSPTTSEISDAGNNSPSSAPAVEPRLVGGIVGGIAGLALIALALFMLLKRYRKQRVIQALDDAGYGGPQAGGPSMMQRSLSFLGGGLAAKNRGVGSSSDPTDVEPAERGFVKVSGRKLPPAIGGPRPEFGSMKSNAQSSSYTGEDSGLGASGRSRSSHGRSRYSTSTVQGAANPFASPPSSPTGPGPAPASRLRETADTDSIEEMRAPPKPPPPRPIYNRQLSLGTDGVGRSHPSHDGSRGSRFTEDIT